MVIRAGIPTLPGGIVLPGAGDSPGTVAQVSETRESRSRLLH
jgi:hypothetical protein